MLRLRAGGEWDGCGEVAAAETHQHHGCVLAGRDHDQVEVAVFVEIGDGDAVTVEARWERSSAHRTAGREPGRSARAYRPPVPRRGPSGSTVRACASCSSPGGQDLRPIFVRLTDVEHLTTCKRTFVAEQWHFTLMYSSSCPNISGMNRTHPPRSAPFLTALTALVLFSMASAQATTLICPSRTYR